MFQENAEIVRDVFQHFAVGGWDSALDLFAPDVEWEVRPDLVVGP